MKFIYLIPVLSQTLKKYKTISLAYARIFNRIKPLFLMKTLNNTRQIITYYKCDQISKQPQLCQIVKTRK